MKGTKSPYQGWMPISPPGPHEHRPIPTPVLSGRFSGAKRIVGVFYPSCGGVSPVVGVKASDDVSDKSFRIVLSDGREVALKEPDFR